MKIGRVDIITEVSMMTSQMYMPREGHLEAVLRVFAFLHQNYNCRMAFDPNHPSINMNHFNKWKWTGYFGEFKKSVPPNAPE